MQSCLHIQAGWHVVARDAMSPVGAGAALTRENQISPFFFFVPYMFAPYMRLPGCQRCFESLVTETQEGWALSNEMMKPRSHLSGNSSMKYWLHQAACFGLTSIWNQLEPSGRGCCCHGPNRYCWHWLQVSDRFCSLCSHWPGTCLEGLNHLGAPLSCGGLLKPPLCSQFFLQIAAEINPVRWCKCLLLGPLVSPEMPRKENWDLLF